MLTITEIRAILYKMGLRTEDISISAKPFICTEDGDKCSVLALTLGGKALVLKEARKYEREVYSDILNRIHGGVPRLYAATDHWGKDYLLMELVDGEAMWHCTRQSLILTLDALISLQSKFWQDEDAANRAYTYEQSLDKRIARGRYLGDRELEAAYAIYLKKYASLPRTLCHDDLLPFNVLISDSQATIIDWEVAGILPYPTSFARLIAHCGEENSAAFSMSSSDREFAVWYYYDSLLRPMGISYDDFHSALDAFLFYEYCEVVMLGNKHGATDSPKYKEYYARAKQLAKKLLH